MSEVPVAHERTTFVAVTPSDGADGNGSRKERVGGSSGAGSTRARPCGRARDRMVARGKAITRGVYLPSVSDRWEKTLEEAAAPDITETDGGAKRHFWHDGPAPAADLVAYTRSGAWLRGQQNVALEMAGQAWGYAVALPLTLILGAVIWCTHRFHRALTLAVVVAVLWATFPSWGGDAAPVGSVAVTSQTGVTP